MGDAPRYHLIPILSLAGVILDALGGLYLAYDLLGGKRGPLRIVTKSVSYGVMFGSAYGLTRLHIRRGHRTQRRTRNFGRSPRNRDLRLICAGHQNEAGHSANHDEAE